MSRSGISLPSLAAIGGWHPQFALAAAEGIPVRPDVRVLSVEFSGSGQIGQALPASFSEPISKASIFGGARFTVDPAAAFSGNVLKGLNDTTLSRVSGITFTLLTTGPEGNYTPVFDEVPVQDVPHLLEPYAGIWMMRGPSENVKGTFTLQGTPNGGFPFTAWLSLSFATLQGPCADYLCMKPDEARKALKEKHGICCP